MNCLVCISAASLPGGQVDPALVVMQLNPALRRDELRSEVHVQLVRVQHEAVLAFDQVRLVAEP